MLLNYYTDKNYPTGRLRTQPCLSNQDKALSQHNQKCSFRSKECCHVYTFKAKSIAFFSQLSEPLRHFAFFSSLFPEYSIIAPALQKALNNSDVPAAGKVSINIKKIIVQVVDTYVIS